MAQQAAGGRGRGELPIFAGGGAHGSPRGRGRDGDGPEMRRLFQFRSVFGFVLVLGFFRALPRDGRRLPCTSRGVRRRVG